MAKQEYVYPAEVRKVLAQVRKEQRLKAQQKNAGGASKVGSGKITN